DLGSHSVPYRVDLYIIPRSPIYVNTFFVTFLTNLLQTLGSVANKSTLYTGFEGSQKFPNIVIKILFSSVIY
ncbi:MAG: hypothetical protein ACI3WT_07345, partial [Phascolarctobacterium sp.]